jgi:hypothetical protein
MKQLPISLLITIIFVFTQCLSTDKDPTSLKIPIDSPFAATAVDSEFFTIDTKKDNVLESKNGTLIVAPKGCFLDKNGKIVTKDIKIELAEALTLEAMIMTGLSAMSDDNPLETDGMIYFYPTKDGEPLTVNPDIPVYIEIPTKDKKPGMMAYKGVPNDSTGIVNWTEPKKLENYLINIDLALLDFLPKGFEKAVLTEMKKRKKSVDDAFIDSLYYALSVMDAADLLEGLPPTDLNEPYYNNKSNVKDRKYQDGSFETGSRLNISPKNDFKVILTQEGEEAPCEVIDPVLIKVMKSTPYQNTFIATREFEKRMKLIHKNCQQSIAELYLKNLDLNLWEIDIMAATKISNERIRKAFKRLSKKEHTNIRNANIYGKLLKGYYEKQLKIVKNELEKVKESYLEELEKANEPARKVVENYKKVLQKRESYRMPKYGFEWTNTGWANIDRPISRKTKPSKILVPTLEVKVKNGNKYDQVYCYTIQKNIKSLYRLNPENNKNFYAGKKTNKRVLMKENSDIGLIVIGYKNGEPAIASKEFNTGEFFDEKEILEKVQLKSTTKDNVSTTINRYETVGVENSIEEDLKFMKALAKEKERQNVIKEEANFISALKKIIYPCCYSYESDRK